MIAFMEAHVGDYGVEPVCKVLQIAPSTWYDHARRRANPDLCSARVKEDEQLCNEITRVHAAIFGVDGARKVWLQLNREGFGVGRDRVARLMRYMELEGVVRGKAVKTTVQDKSAACPFDLVNRQFHASAPNKLWVSDFTYVSTWGGFVYVAFVIDVYARVRRGLEPMVAHASPSAGGSAGTRRQPSFSMPWSRPCTREGQQKASSIIQTVGRNMSAFATPSVWPRPGSNHPSAVSATATTMRLLKA